MARGDELEAGGQRFPFFDGRLPLWPLSVLVVHLLVRKPPERHEVDHEQHAVVWKRNEARVVRVIHLTNPADVHPLTAQADLMFVFVRDIRRAHEAHWSTYNLRATEHAVLVRVEGVELAPLEGLGRFGLFYCSIAIDIELR